MLFTVLRFCHYRPRKGLPSRAPRCSALLVSLAVLGPLAEAAPAEATAASPQLFEQVIRPLTQEYCLNCHSTEKQKGDLDLERFISFDEAKRHPEIWQKVMEMVEDNEMPPEDAPKKPLPAQRAQLLAWSNAMLDAFAMERAGDPGRVVLRRLTNAQYTYTLRDLTGVDSLDPVREFPLDGAAGEGFSNTGQALVMSPVLLTKYLDAGKDIARHAVLQPDGLRFLSGTTRRDWTNEILAEIRGFYRQFTDAPADTINLRGEKSSEGIMFSPAEGGQLPLAKYLRATIIERKAIRTGEKTLAAVARERRLSAKYLSSLWATLNDNNPSPLFDRIRSRWRAAEPAGAQALAAEIEQWQGGLWKFGKVGLLDADARPKSWMEPASLLAERQELRLKLAAPAAAEDIVVYLAAGNAGDGSAGDRVIWEEPRLTGQGRPPLPLRDVPEFVRGLTAERDRILAATTRLLAAAAEAAVAPGNLDITALAARHGVAEAALTTWLEYLGIEARSAVALNLFTHPLRDITAWDFIQGWGSHDTPTLLANSSINQRVRIPGISWPRSVGVHPSATDYAAVGWRSPVAGTVRVDAKVTHEMPEYGNGVTWSLEHRRGRLRRRLAVGTAHVTFEIREASPGVTLEPVEVAVQPGDYISLLVGPGQGDHAGDFTNLKFKLTCSGPTPGVWSLADEVSPNVLEGNPHADHAGTPGVWHFYREPVAASQNLPVIPSGSLVARWLEADSPAEKQRLAEAIQRLLTASPAPDATAPDATVRRQLTARGGPFYAAARSAISPEKPSGHGPLRSPWALDPAKFGHASDRTPIGASDLCVTAPSSLRIRLPADLFSGSELVTTGRLHPNRTRTGSVQLNLQDAPPGALTALEPGRAVLAHLDSEAWARLARSSDDFRRIFPAAICYPKIVPVDEAISVNLFHREDQKLAELMLDEAQQAQLDRLWDELHYVSQAALALLDIYEAYAEGAEKPPVQFPEFPRVSLAPPGRDEPPVKPKQLLRPITDRAAAFRQRLADTQPRHLEAVLEFADRAWRRPLSGPEKEELRGLYGRLGRRGLAHEEAIQLTLARVLVAPAFLYRAENPGPVVAAVPVSDWELASRLSYFLWSSAPDAELRAAVAAGTLRNPDTLAAQAQRMQRDPRARRLATEFGCAWLRIYSFDQLDEKSDRHFPTFVGLRGAMYEESIRFLTDLFQANRSVLNLIDGDYTFLNEALAAHYDIPGVSGKEWRRVDGIKLHSRGGVLGQAAILAKQSGAARTSPILRGNWVAEVLLGDKLPAPPKDVPLLPEDEATEILTVRELTEKHTSDPRCAGCHTRIDPFGYALESFDSIGRWREKDLGNRLINTKTTVMDGTALQGADGLRAYLLGTRRVAFVRQFCRKLLGYSLGRAVHASDKPLLEEMQAHLAANDYQVGSAIETIVRSRQFREIRGREFAPEPQETTEADSSPPARVVTTRAGAPEDGAKRDRLAKLHDDRDAPAVLSAGSTPSQQ